MEYWGDSVVSAVCATGILRYTITRHIAQLIHSAMHIWGLKPDDKYVPYLLIGIPMFATFCLNSKSGFIKDTLIVYLKEL